MNEAAAATRRSAERRTRRWSHARQQPLLLGARDQHGGSEAHRNHAPIRELLSYFQSSKRIAAKN